mmetsp:Transcript_59647/g.174445  ORF Transcript_59647/g.174445 Transcript_59647/m.174445 type:complete len:234 (+) Transcript_59647:578-1279(+)
MAASTSPHAFQVSSVLLMTKPHASKVWGPLGTASSGTRQELLRAGDIMYASGTSVGGSARAYGVGAVAGAGASATAAPCWAARPRMTRDVAATPITMPTHRAMGTAMVCLKKCFQPRCSCSLSKRLGRCEMSGEAQSAVEAVVEPPVLWREGASLHQDVSPSLEKLTLLFLPDLVVPIGWLLSRGLLSPMSVTDILTSGESAPVGTWASWSMGIGGKRRRRTGKSMEDMRCWG